MVPGPTAAAAAMEAGRLTRKSCDTGPVGFRSVALETGVSSSPLIMLSKLFQILYPSDPGAIYAV